MKAKEIKTDSQANICIHGVDRKLSCTPCLAIMVLVYGPKPN